MNKFVISLAYKNPLSHQCPRCKYWHTNDGPIFGETLIKDKPTIICWKCQETLIIDHPNHEATKLVKDWREKNIYALLGNV